MLQTNAEIRSGTYVGPCCEDKYTLIRIQIISTAIGLIIVSSSAKNAAQAGNIAPPSNLQNLSVLNN